IEADGYEPTVSKPLDLQSEAASCDVALRREDPRMAVNGVVRLPDGQPAAGAEVALCTPEKGICLGKARFVFSRNSIITNADVAGRFSFTPHRDAHTVVAIHPEGFVRSRVNDSIRTVELKLQPWGRLEGVVRAANQPPGAQDVILTDESYVNYGGAVSLDLSSYSTKTDRERNFKFDQVPPGGFFLYLDPGMGKSFSHKTPVEVQPGETQRVQIGGTGRRVTGRFIAPDAREPIDWSKQTRFATLSSKLAPLPQPTGLDAESLEWWKVDFWQSEQGW